MDISLRNFLHCGRRRRFYPVQQLLRTRVKHSEGCSGRNKLPGKGRRCARLLLGMGAITAHQPALPQRRHTPQTQTPQSWKRPSGLFHDWLARQSSNRRKTSFTARKPRFLAVVHRPRRRLLTDPSLAAAIPRPATDWSHDDGSQEIGRLGQLGVGGNTNGQSGINAIRRQFPMPRQCLKSRNARQSAKS